jgi:uncharacterized protein YceH (UPF0502 family)
LSAIEARVLATLMEKARTVPDSYPLTLNSLVTGCNQKSSRDPVMEVSEGEAQEALDSLRLKTLSVQISSVRSTRWEHNFPRGIGVPDQSAVLLALLMLRGPQTAGELRINSERWHRFADISSVEAFLDELRERSEEKGGPLVVQLPRAPAPANSAGPTCFAARWMSTPWQAPAAPAQAAMHRPCSSVWMRSKPKSPNCAPPCRCCANRWAWSRLLPG